MKRNARMPFSFPKILRRHSIVQALLASKLIQPEQTIKFNGNSQAFVNLSDPEPRNVFLKSVFDPDFFHVAKSFLRKGSSVFDLGANMGFCSFGLVPNYPDLSYHLFEANPQLIHLLKRSIELHPLQKFVLNHACISDRAGTTRFQLEPNQSGQSHVSTQDGSGIKVSNLTLDDYCGQQMLDSVDFAKIDLEGHELPALQGWNKCLSKHRVKAIYLEIMPENQTRYGRQTKAPLCYLESLGYELYLCKQDDFGSFGSAPSKTYYQDNSLLSVSVPKNTLKILQPMYWHWLHLNKKAALIVLNNKHFPSRMQAFIKNLLLKR